MKSKKLLILLSIIFLMASALAVTACINETYTISFELNGEVQSEIEDIMVKANKKATKPADPISKDDDIFVFAGWYKDQEFKQEFNFETEKIVGNMTLYAYWDLRPDKSITTKIIYDFQDGIGTETETVVEFKKDFEFTVPTREGYNFIGWYSHKDAKGFKYTSFDGKSIAPWNTATAVDEFTVYAYWYKKGGEPYDYGAGKMKAPDFTVDLIDENGFVKQVKLSDYYGIKPVIVSIWATT